MPKPTVIALEEHYWDAEVAAHFPDAATMGGPPPLLERLHDVGALRLKEMDEAGIDVQVLSHGAPATQQLDAATAVSVARGANDRLARIVAARPERFAAFAVLPTPDPAAAVDELARSVNELGCKGAMIHGLTNGLFLDDKRFWPIFAKAQELDVPLYIHPAIPHPAVVDIYLKEYVADYPGILNAAWGFTMETATAGIRLVLSGVCDAYPDVKLVLGHLGETLPFLLWRIDSVLRRPPNKAIRVAETFRNNFHITTSGFFSDPALLCCIQEVGVERILFSVDYPFAENLPGTAWMERLQLNGADKAKILHGNARRLLKL
jgi:2,3-dihydroxybenzoate decarboxylase